MHAQLANYMERGFTYIFRDAFYLKDIRVNSGAVSFYATPRFTATINAGQTRWFDQLENQLRSCEGFTFFGQPYHSLHDAWHLYRPVNYQTEWHSHIVFGDSVKPSELECFIGAMRDAQEKYYGECDVRVPESCFFSQREGKLLRSQYAKYLKKEKQRKSTGVNQKKIAHANFDHIINVSQQAFVSSYLDAISQLYIEPYLIQRGVKPLYALLGVGAANIAIKCVAFGPTAALSSFMCSEVIGSVLVNAGLKKQQAYTVSSWISAGLIFYNNPLKNPLAFVGVTMASAVGVALAHKTIALLPKLKSEPSKNEEDADPALHPSVRYARGY